MRRRLTTTPTRLGSLLAWLLAATLAYPSSLRDLRLELLEANGGGWANDAAIEMLDSSGRRFACRAKKLSEQDEQKPEAQSVGELLGALDGLCARLNQGWWTYEWCHRQEIHQYHQDTVNGPRSPNWSLGGYSPKTSNDGDHPAALDRAVDIFDVGGQRCDETNRGRMSRVTFGCCEDGGPSRARASKRSRKMSTSPSGPRGAYLVSVEETALCEYALSVCAPSLCTSQSSNVTASRLLSTMEGSCLRRPEGWWEFEFCYKKHVRQYHVEDRKYVADFSLGKFQGKEEDLVVIVEDGDEPRVEIEYEGGTECDTTTNAKRATTIKLICGDTPAFLNVVEDRTCHYVFTVQTPALCKHPEFANFFNPNARPVQCDEVSDE